VIVIHDTLLTAVHGHPLPVDTFTLRLSPCMGALSLVREIEYEHEGGGGGGGAGGGAGGGGGSGLLLAACVTVKTLPAIVTVPVRAAAPFTATLNVTEPLPAPVAPDVTVIQDALLVAVHWHVLGAETVTGVPAPPAAGMLWLVGEIAAVQLGGGDGGEGALTPACVTVGRWFTTAIEPVRAAPSFGATVKVTVAGPLPAAEDVSVIQPTSAVAVHAHSFAVAIVRRPNPAFAATLWLDGAMS